VFWTRPRLKQKTDRVNMTSQIVGEEFAQKLELLDLTLCKSCFVKIKDVNGESIEAEPHKCNKQVMDSLRQSIASLVKNAMTDISDEKVVRLWALHNITNSLVDSHLSRAIAKKESAERKKNRRKQQAEANQ
jgi:hypothetical protein